MDWVGPGWLGWVEVETLLPGLAPMSASATVCALLLVATLRLRVTSMLACVVLLTLERAGLATMSASATVCALLEATFRLRVASMLACVVLLTLERAVASALVWSVMACG